MTDKPLDNRIAVVTGASRGIGYAAAKALAAAGAHIVAIARTQGGLEELDDEIQAAGGTATLVPLDLKDGAGIDRLGGVLYSRFGRIDVLVGNAGVLGALTPLAHLDPKVWDEALAVNVTANYRLIRSLDPLLRQSDAGRAVFLTSGAARKLTPYWGVYAVTKAALEAMVGTYARETAITKVKANLLSPGPTRTAMRARAMPGEDPDTLPTPDTVAPSILRLVAADLAETGRTWDHRAGGWA